MFVYALERNAFAFPRIAQERVEATEGKSELEHNSDEVKNVSRKKALMEEIFSSPTWVF